MEKQNVKTYKYILVAVFQLDNNNNNMRISAKVFEKMMCIEDEQLITRKMLSESMLYSMIITDSNLKSELEKYCEFGKGLHTHYHVFRIDDEHNKTNPVFGYHTFVDTAFAY